jgi:SAM-dependent methyltransferase
MGAERRSGVVHDREGLSARLNAWRKRSLFSPYYLDWRHQKAAVERLAGDARGVMLDVGTSEGPYRAAFAARVQRYVGLEYPPSILEKRPDLWRILDRAKRSVDVFGDGNRLPFGAGTVDTVLSTEVLEHLPDPARCLREMRRVLKPGGRLLLTVPFLQPLHELPSDFYRFTPSSLRALAEDVGLVVERIEPRGNFAVACGALISQYLLRTLGARELQPDGSVLPSAWRNLLLAPIYALVQGSALVLARLSDDGAVALGYSLVARKP